MSHLKHGFHHIAILLCFALLGGGLAGCKYLARPSNDVPQLLNTTPPFERGSAILLPGADYRLAVVRAGPDFRQSDGSIFYGQDILCSEPSPDWAIAFGNAFAAAASGGASGGPSGSLSGSGSTTEAITAATGRTAGVVALRDGLYAACQAYANQEIGKDAYSLILSQYGNLLVALASSGGGGTGGSASATPASTSPSGVAVAVSTGSTSGSAKPSGTSSGSDAPQGGNAQSPVVQQTAQGVQAMLVACISHYDQSIPHATNTLLERNCPEFFRELGTELPSLLKPPGATGQGPSGSKQAGTGTKHTAQGQHPTPGQAPTQDQPQAKPAQ
jgi:hypothetical protein